MMRRLVFPTICFLLSCGCSEYTGNLAVDPEMVRLQWAPERDGRQAVTMKLKNNGRAPLVIKNVLTSCTCTVASGGTSRLNPGEEAEVSLNVHVPRYGGQEILVTIETDSQVTPSRNFRIQVVPRKEDIPQIWRMTESTLLKFEQIGIPVFGRVEVVAIEKSSETPLVVGLTSGDGKDSTAMQCDLERMTEETSGGESVVRTYRFIVSVTPTTFDRQSLVLVPVADGIPNGNSWKTVVNMDPAPIIRIRPSQIEIKRLNSGVSETVLVLIAEDGLPIDQVQQAESSWYKLVCDDGADVSPTSSMKRMKLVCDWDQQPATLPKDEFLTFKIDHPNCSEVYIPIRIID
eukprot:TRINITY_DN759_c0_g1_i2.p1 TRINITY_DN759_c0_g1~~TRINITY_DN759_c0_g1_i2.p1  ORF type:complete len:346 (-),score=44.57 TRINITY_DN759_c0_g1_i2:207-1244(-)